MIHINITLKRLCELPDINNSPVVAISASNDDKLKVSVGRIAESGEYLEGRIKVCDTYGFAVSYAFDFAKLIHTDHIYEIRVFKDNTADCIRILNKMRNEENMFLGKERPKGKD